MTVHDDAVGYAACFVAVVFFGSNFVPVKRVPTADGMFFSLVMTSAVLIEGLAVQLIRGNPKFEPFAMLGGAIWATGNLTVVPIVKSIGLGLGLLIWGLVGMLVGWASGHFGILGVAADPPLVAPWANYAGVVFACARYASGLSQIRRHCLRTLFDCSCTRPSLKGSALRTSQVHCFTSNAGDCSDRLP
mgnify:FL=1